MALLVKHKQCDAGDRLGHRVDAVQRVLAHRFGAFAVGHAPDLVVDDLSASRDEPLAADHDSVANGLAHAGVDSGKPRGGKAQRFGIRHRWRGAVRQHGPG
jgi:hypothetical protein